MAFESFLISFVQLKLKFTSFINMIIQYCQGLSGTLVQIQDWEQENAVRKILSTFTERYWIGLTDVNIEGQFVWSLSQTTATWYKFYLKLFTVLVFFRYPMHYFA